MVQINIFYINNTVTDITMAKENVDSLLCDFAYKKSMFTIHDSNGNAVIINPRLVTNVTIINEGND